MKNCSEENCNNCTLLTGGNGTPPNLLRFAVVHCCLVLGFGTICNLVALWCVVTCTKTRPAVKILLCSMLSSTFLMCVIVMPLGIEVVLTELLCDPNRVPLPVIFGLVLLYNILVQMEYFYIASVAFFRAAAVWCPQRHTVGVRIAVGLVVGIGIYATATSAGFLSAMLLNYVTDVRARQAIGLLYCFLHTILPVVFTIVCYCSMMIAVRRNKQRLARSQHNIVSCDVMDQATRAMLAVFVSNIFLALPHSIFHAFDTESFTLYVSIHIVFYMHLVVDPIVFVWFNHHHRQRVAGKIRAGLDKISCWASAVGATSTVALHSPPTTETDP